MMVTDYYAMLGVDPRADRAAIEAALSRSQPLWSSGTRNPKTKHTCQSNLDQIQLIRQTLLGDPATRAAYDAELAAAHRAERDLKLDALQKLVRLRAAKGGLTVSDRKLLRDEAAKLSLENEALERLIEAIPPLPESPAAVAEQDEPAGDVLDPVIRRQIHLALDHLRKRDLYDALDLPRDVPAREIAARADTERQRWMRKTQVTAEKTAWLEVATLAQSHLLNPVARARYDRSLLRELEDAFVVSVKFAVKGLTRLDPGTNAVLLDEAEASGISADRAERLVSRTCRELGVGGDGFALGLSPGLAAFAASLDGPPRHLRCRSCGGITEHSRVERQAKPVCRHCESSLLWTCPVCQKTRWVDEPRCACGFRIELREPLVTHFEAAQQAFRTRDYAAALAHLKRVQELATKHVGARNGIAKVKEKVAAIDRSKAAFELAKAAGRLFSAKSFAEAWGALVDPASPDWRAAYTEVTRLLRDAQTLATKARKRERLDPAAARDYYRQSLAIASDLPEAVAGLKRCPPDPPSELKAEYVADKVRLRWSPPPPDGVGPVSYVILRKPEAAFTHPGDGLRVGESAMPAFDDSGVTPGTSVAYAVLTRRGDVESLGAVAVGPIYLMGEVRDVQVDARGREVHLSWTPPQGVSEVRVIRKRGVPPSGPTDGEPITSLIDQAHDHGLEPDRVYHYGLFSIYRTPDGRAVASRGVFVAARPQTPVRPLDAPTLATEPDGRVVLHWVEPPRGMVKIVRTGKPFPHSPGTRLAPAQVAAIEGTWLDVDLPDEARDLPPPSGICYYTPLTSWGGSVTVGHSSTHSCVTDPSELRASRVGNQVHLRWRWSPHGNQSLVVSKPGSPPTGPDDPSAHVETVHEADYARLGRHTIALPPGDTAPWHVAVYALATLDGRFVTSPGTDPSARTLVTGPNPEITVSYTFQRARLTARKWSITFHTEPPGAPVPPTVLVIHPRTVPLSPDDGTIVAEFPESRDGQSLPLPPDHHPRRSHARIFPDPRAEPDKLHPIRLRHPESDRTRV